jgi:hypothetical protein
MPEDEADLSSLHGAASPDPGVNARRVLESLGEAECMELLADGGLGRLVFTSRYGRTAVLTDQRPVMASARRNELIHRLLAGHCEICAATVSLEVHHVRKLADLTKPGRRDKPAWMHLMAMRRRKTLVTCRRCHEDIHAGRATKPYPK